MNSKKTIKLKKHIFEPCKLISFSIKQFWNLFQQCPHPAFLRKHWCEFCLNEEDALIFSTERFRLNETSKNTVITGQDLSRKFKLMESNQKRCHNYIGSVVFECNLRGNFCKIRGKNCTTYHHPGNSHMFYQDTRCIEFSDKTED